MANARGGGILRGREKHRLHNIDAAHRVADCESCGRQVDIHSMMSRVQTRKWDLPEWVCGPAWRWRHRDYPPSVSFEDWEEAHQ